MGFVLMFLIFSRCILRGFGLEMSMSLSLNLSVDFGSLYSCMLASAITCRAHSISSDLVGWGPPPLPIPFSGAFSNPCLSHSDSFRLLSLMIGTLGCFRLLCGYVSPGAGNGGACAMVRSGLDIR